MSKIRSAVQLAEQLIAANPADCSRLKIALTNFKRVNHPGLKSDQSRLSQIQLVEELCNFSEPTTIRPDPKPITIVARTGGIAYQGYWGRCVNDMSGFIAPAGPIPLNYDHCTEGEAADVIGVSDSLKIVDGELIVTGRLLPFSDDDTAAQVIYKGSQGVRYQASVELDLPSTLVAEVADGQTVSVNGKDFTGPGVLFTRWGVSAIAITPSGADASTSVQFRRAQFSEWLTKHLRQK